jgi:hemolysin activation/secretion protein
MLVRAALLALTWAMAWIAIDAAAQQPPAVLNPVDRLAPRPAPNLSPSASTPPPVAATGPNAGALVRVTKVGLRGNLALGDAELATAVAGLTGREVPLSRLEDVRLAILRAYRAADYAFTAVNAGLSPAEGGVEVTFAITEGFVAEVKLEGDIGAAGTQVLRFLDRLVGVKPVSGAMIERALLLASDVPGVTVRGTLRPLTTEPGALQLVAQVEHKSISGYLNVDNRAYRYVGPWQGLLTFGVNSLTELGERSELSFFGTPTGAQWFTQGSEEFFIGGSGLRLRFYAGTGITRPFGKVGANGYQGQAQVGGASLSYPLFRSRPFNLTAVTALDFFDSTVTTGFGDNRTRASLDKIRILRGGLDFQLLDSWVPLLAAATSQGNFRIHNGLNGMGATATNSITAARAGSNFGFTKVTGEVQRTQSLFSPFEQGMFNLQGLFAGQWTDDVLPSAEKYYLGGSRLNRGFYNGQVSGDRAWAAAVELQLDTAFELPTEPVIGNGRYTAQWYFFRDVGRTFENLRTDPARRLSSYGGGVRLVVSETVQFDAEVAQRITRRPDGAAADPLRETGALFRMLVRY